MSMDRHGFEICEHKDDPGKFFIKRNGRRWNSWQIKTGRLPSRESAQKQIDRYVEAIEKREKSGALEGERQ